jgi:hypothetical protein
MAYLGTKPANQVIDSTLIADGTITPSDLSTGKPVWDTSGNVGIGTSSPSYKLDVVGNIGIKSNDAFYRGTSVAGTSIRLLGLAADDNVYVGSIDSLTGSNTIFRTNGTERMRIFAGGEVSINSTSIVGQFYVAGSSNAHGFGTRTGFNGSFGGNVFNIMWTSTAQLYIDTTNVGTITLTSDYRIKRNIETQTAPALERVMALRPVTYQMADYKTLFKASEDIKEGFIAHEVQEVIPSGAEGVKDDPNQIQSLRVDAILAVAVKAIQELKAELDTVKTELATLKGTA